MARWKLLAKIQAWRFHNLKFCIMKKYFLSCTIRKGERLGWVDETAEQQVLQAGTSNLDQQFKHGFLLICPFWPPHDAQEVFDMIMEFTLTECRGHGSGRVPVCCL